MTRQCPDFFLNNELKTKRGGGWNLYKNRGHIRILFEWKTHLQKTECRKIECSRRSVWVIVSSFMSAWNSYSRMFATTTYIQTPINVHYRDDDAHLPSWQMWKHNFHPELLDRLVGRQNARTTTKTTREHISNLRGQRRHGGSQDSAECPRLLIRLCDKSWTFHDEIASNVTLIYPQKVRASRRLAKRRASERAS